jgi:hypothetical protein
MCILIKEMIYRKDIITQTSHLDKCGDDLCDSTRFQKQVEFLDHNPEYAIVGTSMVSDE